MCSSKTASSQSKNQSKAPVAEPFIWPVQSFQADECCFYNEIDNFYSDFNNNDVVYESCAQTSLQNELYQYTQSPEQCVNLDYASAQSQYALQSSSLATVPATFSCDLRNENSFHFKPSIGNNNTLTHHLNQKQQQSQHQQYYLSYQKSSPVLSANAPSYQQRAPVCEKSIQSQQEERQEYAQHFYGITSNQASFYPNTPSSYRPLLDTAAPSPSYKQLQSNVYGETPILPAPCRGNQPWTYAYCYGYAQNNQEPCRYTQFVDIEDFMNNEKRKEKSRDAARCRRSRETEIFSDLAKVLPLKREDVNQLDKASIMRIAIVYLKVREMLQLFPNIQELNDVDQNETDTKDSGKKTPKISDDLPFDVMKCSDAYQILKKTLDGFLLILSNDGDIAYVSESVTDYLGLAKIDMLGQQIWEYSHQCDHAELREALNMKRNGLADKVKDEQILEEGLSTDHRDLFVRFKCTLTSRGRSINIKSASYKIVHLTGHLVINTKGDRVLIAIGRPIPHPINIETPLCPTTFMTKHSLDMKFTYVDDKMQNLLSYKPEDLLEKSLFNCHHGSDTDSLMATFKIVLSKGQGETCRYRFLGKYGGYCWIVTQATVVYDKLKPQSVVCVNYVISNLEKDHEIYSLEQYEANQSRIKTEEINIKNNNNNNNSENNNNINTKNNNNTEIKSNDEKNSISKPTTIQDIKPLANESNKNSDSDSESNSNRNRKSTENNIKNNNAINNNEKKLDPLEITAAIIDENNSNSNSNSNSIEISPVKRLNLQLTPPITTTSTKAIPPTKTVTHTLISKSRRTSSSPPRPKSVTASVFRAAPNILPNIVTKNNNNSNNKSTDFNSSATNNKTANNKNDIVISPICQINKPNHQLKQSINNLKATSPISASLAVQQQQRDMNRGYLTFAEDATNEPMLLKNDPDDLAHLVPSTNIVDPCMPLDENTPLFNEMFVGLMSSYDSPLPDDINTIDSMSPSTEETALTKQQLTRITIAGEVPKTNASKGKIDWNNTNKFNSSSYNNIKNDSYEAPTTSKMALLNSKSNAHIDPFINYREESNDTNSSPHLLSPSIPSTSPEASSLPSLCSPNSIIQDDEFAFMTMSVDDDIDLTMRAPYIPMNEQDDLPLLTDDLMWCGSNALSSDDMQKDISDVMQHQIQQLQQIQAACDNSDLRGNMIDFITIPPQQEQLGVRQKQLQPEQINLNNQFANLLCSSPSSATSKLSTSSVNNLQQNAQDYTNPTTIIEGDSNEFESLMCGSGNGTLTILDSDCNVDNQIGGNINNGVNVIANSNQQINNFTTSNNDGCIGYGVINNGGIIFHQPIILQQNDENIQTQQELVGGLNMDGALENLYIEDTTNIDCLNDFSPINVNDATSLATADVTCRQLEMEYQNENCKQQFQQQQELLFNSVPLITIENDQDIMLQQQQLQQQELQQGAVINHNVLSNCNLNKMIVNDEKLSGAIPTEPKINRVAKVIKLQKIPNSNIPIFQIINENKPQQTQPTTLPHNQSVTKKTIIETMIHPTKKQSNKRHLKSNSIQIKAKRLNISTTKKQPAAVELKATPQLIIKPMQQQQQTQVKAEVQLQNEKRKLNGEVWCIDENKLKKQKLQHPQIQQPPQIQKQPQNQVPKQQQQQKPQQQQQQQQQPQEQQQQPIEQSDSVLKNLLINGYDVSAGYNFFYTHPKRLLSKA